MLVHLVTILLVVIAVSLVHLVWSYLSAVPLIEDGYGDVMEPVAKPAVRVSAARRERMFGRSVWESASSN